ncbi:hypothetical protein [Desmospora activa]|uniref:Uncharacterized protein n=1 Tax=Desmospora activa DSM 45169 TaxID=1121389 RepID=A0A2T4YYX5_9BACL|nr:hypothetical protein [Desmospora activa]PTM52176.1 hypothetical protein C8J48_3723 [Desmospora activa DSM 45169]
MAIVMIAAVGFISYLLLGKRVTSCLFQTVGLFALFVFGILLWGVLTFGKTPPP